MLLPIKPICSGSKIRRDGTSLVFIQYCQSAENKTLLNTEIAIPPNYWNKKLERISDNLPTAFGIANNLNKEIQRQVRLAEDIISYALANKIPDPVQFAKSTFTPGFNLSTLQKAPKESKAVRPKVNRDFFVQFDDYIKSKEKSVAPSTLQVFKNLKVILQSFESYREKAISFDEIDYNFYEEFLNYLSFEHIHQNKKEVLKGFKTNTVGKNIKQLIIFLKNRKQKKIVPELAHIAAKGPSTVKF